MPSQQEDFAASQMNNIMQRARQNPLLKQCIAALSYSPWASIMVYPLLREISRRPEEIGLQKHSPLELQAVSPVLCQVEISVALLTLFPGVEIANVVKMVSLPYKTHSAKVKMHVDSIQRVLVSYPLNANAPACPNRLRCLISPDIPINAKKLACVSLITF